MRLIFVLALSGCMVGGDPTAPAEPTCPDIIIYVSFDDGEMSTDSVTYHPCET